MNTELMKKLYNTELMKKLYEDCGLGLAHYYALEQTPDKLVQMPLDFILAHIDDSATAQRIVRNIAQDEAYVRSWMNTEPDKEFPYHSGEFRMYFNGVKHDDSEMRIGGVLQPNSGETVARFNGWKAEYLKKLQKYVEDGFNKRGTNRNP